MREELQLQQVHHQLYQPSSLYCSNLTLFRLNRSIPVPIALKANPLDQQCRLQLKVSLSPQMRQQDSQCEPCFALLISLLISLLNPLT